MLSWTAWWREEDRVDFEMIFSIALVTAGAGVIGVAIAQLLLGRIRRLAFASDVLLGAGAAVAGIASRTPGAAVTGAMWAGLALVTSGTLLHLRGMRDKASRQSPPIERRHDNSLDRRS
jgi:hypothetical protein